MKTKTQISALILIISLMFATNTFAFKKNFGFDEEAYIDDIPFNTEWVVHNLSLTTVDFEEEAYIDDVPFSTFMVVAKYNYNISVAVEFEMGDETNIDDMPFDTELVVSKYVYNKTVSEEYEMVDEAYINDIPFDTYSITLMSNEIYKTYWYALEK